MRFTALVACAAAVGVASGAAITKIVPTAEIAQAGRDLAGSLSSFHVADLNPIRAAYDAVSARIQAGHTPEELGFSSSSVTLTMPDPKDWPGQGFKPSPDIQKGWNSSSEAQIRENNDRMRDIANYARNPAGWHGPPPH